jgi:hypothetical protein
MDDIWALDTPHIIRIGETRFRKDGIPSSLFEGHEHKQRCICNIVCLFQTLGLQEVQEGGADVPVVRLGIINTLLQYTHECKRPACLLQAYRVLSVTLYHARVCAP